MFREPCATGTKGLTCTLSLSKPHLMCLSIWLFTCMYHHLVIFKCSEFCEPLRQITKLEKVIETPD